MDGIHDLGGKQGFGRIQVDEAEVPFHHVWEGREWGISRCARTPGITIDWWRHCRELILAEDYLTRPYFDSWAQTDFATYIDAGVLSLNEIVSATAEAGSQQQYGSAEKLNKAQVLQADRHKAARFDAEIDDKPLFTIGQSVLTAKHGNEGHTRLPQYARNRQGSIHAHHGAHVFPDLSAKGIEVHQHLYSVELPAFELWPEQSGSKDKVYLDLWESYLSGSETDD